MELPPEDAELARQQARNAFFHSLPPEAQERFLETLSDAGARGLDEESAWKEAAEAAETTYAPPKV